MLNRLGQASALFSYDTCSRKLDEVGIHLFVSMESRHHIVKVTRRGQTTIPVDIRRRLRIEEGTRLVVEDRGNAIVFRPLRGLEDDAGFLAGRTTVRKLVRIVEEAREDEE